MKFSLLTIALLAALGTAHAGQGHDTPKGGTGQPGTSTSSAGGGGGGGGGAGVGVGLGLGQADADAAAKAAADAAAIAAQQQAQQQQQAAQAAALAAGGTALGQGGNGTGGTGTGSVAVTGGTTSTTTNIRTTIIPPFVPSTTAPLPSAAIATVQGQCGGQVMAIMREVTGREAHIVKDTTEFHFGWTEVIRPLTDANGKPTPFDTTSMPGYVLGHQYTIVTGQAQVSIENSGALTVVAKSVGLGGGAAGGGQLSQPISAVSIQTCVLASPKEPVAFTMPPKVETEIVYLDRPISKPRNTTPRKPRVICKPGQAVR